jgi:hypothetical protein
MRMETVLSCRQAVSAREHAHQIGAALRIPLYIFHREPAIAGEPLK